MRPLLGAFLVVALATPALAQRVELTPIVGYRVGGSLAVVDSIGGFDERRELEVAEHAAYGAHLAVRVSEEGELELVYARQDTELRTDDLFTGQPVLELALETWQLGGNYLFGDDGRVRPYIGVGLGLTRLLPKPDELADETRFAASIAGGVKVWLARNLGLRFEVRGFFTVLDGDHQTFCSSPGACHVETRGSDISQAEIRGGLVLRF